MQVRKRDGSIEPFRREKVALGITKAASGQSLGAGVIDAFVDRVLDRVAPEAPGLPVPTHDIGQVVLDQLNDELPATDVARIRFAMVYLGKRRGKGGFRDALDLLRWLDVNYPVSNLMKPTAVCRCG